MTKNYLRFCPVHFQKLVIENNRIKCVAPNCALDYIDLSYIEKDVLTDSAQELFFPPVEHIPIHCWPNAVFPAIFQRDLEGEGKQIYLSDLRFNISSIAEKAGYDAPNAIINTNHRFKGRKNWLVSVVFFRYMKKQDLIEAVRGLPEIVRKLPESKNGQDISPKEQGVTVLCSSFGLPVEENRLNEIPEIVWSNQLELDLIADLSEDAKEALFGEASVPSCSLSSSQDDFVSTLQPFHVIDVYHEPGKDEPPFACIGLFSVEMKRRLSGSGELKFKARCLAENGSFSEGIGRYKYGGAASYDSPDLLLDAGGFKIISNHNHKELIRPPLSYLNEINITGGENQFKGIFLTDSEGARGSFKTYLPKAEWARMGDDDGLFIYAKFIERCLDYFESSPVTNSVKISLPNSFFLQSHDEWNQAKKEFFNTIVANSDFKNLADWNDYSSGIIRYSNENLKFVFVAESRCILELVKGYFVGNQNTIIDVGHTTTDICVLNQSFFPQFQRNTAYSYFALRSANGREIGAKSFENRMDISELFGQNKIPEYYKQSITQCVKKALLNPGVSQETWTRDWRTTFNVICTDKGKPLSERENIEVIKGQNLIMNNQKHAFKIQHNMHEDINEFFIRLKNHLNDNGVNVAIVNYYFNGQIFNSEDVQEIAKNYFPGAEFEKQPNSVVQGLSMIN